eukprot:TRINITY_DN4557_c0_g1_i1.p1 TRINITY_DN4557_c0_g1~~TRINITY_DN4557_c0_g1_i1.p1  ORF type:complete len:296 (-),score=19.52 TRINITY_DN4557_c0_g1_i1:30-917(-)
MEVINVHEEKHGEQPCCKKSANPIEQKRCTICRFALVPNILFLLYYVYILYCHKFTLIIYVIVSNVVARYLFRRYPTISEWKMMEWFWYPSTILTWIPLLSSQGFPPPLDLHTLLHYVSNILTFLTALRLKDECFLCLATPMVLILAGPLGFSENQLQIMLSIIFFIDINHHYTSPGHARTFTDATWMSNVLISIFLFWVIEGNWIMFIWICGLAASTCLSFISQNAFIKHRILDMQTVIGCQIGVLAGYAITGILLGNLRASIALGLVGGRFIVGFFINEEHRLNRPLGTSPLF